VGIEVILRYFRYTKEEIDQMSDMDALRRYYIATKLLVSMSGGSGGEYGSHTPPPSASPAAVPRRGRSAKSADSYSFPSG